MQLLLQYGCFYITKLAHVFLLTLVIKLSHTCLQFNLNFFFLLKKYTERKSPLNNLCLYSIKTTKLSHNNFFLPLVCIQRGGILLYYSYVQQINAIIYSSTYLSFREVKLQSYVLWVCREQNSGCLCTSPANISAACLKPLVT